MGLRAVFGSSYEVTLATRVTRPGLAPRRYRERPKAPLGPARAHPQRVTVLPAPGGLELVAARLGGLAWIFGDGSWRRKGCGNQRTASGRMFRFVKVWGDLGKRPRSAWAIRLNGLETDS